MASNVGPDRDNGTVAATARLATAPTPTGGNSVAALLRGRPMARRVVFGVAAIVVIAAFAVWRYDSGRETTDDAQIDGHIVPIASRVGGTIAAVKVNDNQFVEVGTVLVEIDQRDYRVALQRAEADHADAQALLAAARAGVPITSTTTTSQLSAAGASVERAEAGGSAASRDIEAAQARLVSAKARLREVTANATRVGRDLERMKQLIAKDEISQQQYDATVAAAEAAQAAVESARASVEEATQAVSMAESRRVQASGLISQAHAELRTAGTGRDQLAVTQARAQSAEARVQLTQAALAQAHLNLEYTTIKAPAAGIVSKKSAEPGQIVQPGQPLLAIVPTARIWVTANFKETQLRDIRTGQLATVSVDAYGHTYRGRVESIAAATGARFSLLPPENATGNYVKVVQRVPVKIVLDEGQDPAHQLRPGMSVVPTVWTR